MNIGFLGTGKMATAIAQGLIEQQAWSKEQMSGMDISPEARQKFSEATGIKSFEHIPPLAERSDIIVFAIKPQQAEAAAKAAREYCADKLVVSVIAGLPLDKLEKWLEHSRIVRVMPNTPATIGRGVSVYTRGSEVGSEDAANVERMLGAVGLVRQVEESLLDAATALSGSGPAYVFEFIQGLTEAGEEVGLDPETALQLTVQTVAGAAAMVQQKIGAPEELRNAVASPGGTTEAGLKVLDKGKLRRLLTKAVRAARDRSRELSRQ